jgi:asparagine synthase (glutamine-hydrolysing)
MAHGVEARVPYLDPAVLDAAARVPLEYNFRKGERKAVLKEVARRHLPSKFVTHRKKGFSSPLVSWRDPGLVLWGDRLLDKGYLVGAGLLRPDWRERLATGPSQVVNGSRAWWLLLTAELWARRWLDAGSMPLPGTA